MKFTLAEIEQLREEFLPPDVKSRLLDELKKRKPGKLDPTQELERFYAYFRSNQGRPYQTTHNDLVRRARNAAASPGNTVTEFSGWVHSLYLPRASIEQNLEAKKYERMLAKRITPVPSISNWKLIHIDPLDGSVEPKMISRLTFGGRPLRGIPDLVFKKKRTGNILIVERKTYFGNLPVPSDGWPDLRAQLWAYGLCDAWRDAPSLRLVGEIWGVSNQRMYRRATLSWECSDVEFDSQNTQLFELYGGVRRYDA